MAQCDGYIYDRQCKGEIHEHEVIFHYLSSIDDDHMLNTNNPPEQVMICAYHYNKIMTENSGEQPIETWGSEWIKARENLFCNAGYNKEEIIDEAGASEAGASEAGASEAGASEAGASEAGASELD